MILLDVIQLYLPGFIKKKKLQELFSFTADAFQSEVPKLDGLTFDECLLKYAIFTKQQAESLLRNGSPVKEVEIRLYQNSYHFGCCLRKSLHIKSWEDTIKLLKTIYQLIGIELHYSMNGEIIIKECYFSKFYSSEVCRLISALDEGLAAGLSDGGKLIFHQRITEGHCCCKGYFGRRI